VYHSLQIVPDHDILDLAKGRQLALFTDSITPLLTLWYGMAVRLTLSETNANRLFQYGVLQIWQQPDTFRADFGGLWWQVCLRMQERSRFLGTNNQAEFSPSGLAIGAPSERVLHQILIEGKTLNAGSAQLNIAPNLANERLALALAELYCIANGEILNEADLFTAQVIYNRLLQLEFSEEQWVDAATLQHLMPKALLAFECYVFQYSSKPTEPILTSLSEALRNAQLPTVSEYGIKVEPLDPTLAVTTKSKLIVYQVSVVLMGVGLFIFSFLLIQTFLRLQKQEQELALQQKEKEILYQNFLRSQKRNAETEQTMNLIQREKANVYYLKSTNYAPDADIVVFWSKKSGRVFVYLNKLEAPAKNHIYKIWAIQKISSGLPVFKSLALLPNNGSDQTLISAGFAQNTDGFIISEETDPNTKNITSDRIIAKFPLAY
jgi:hypothetical protein